MENRNQTTRPMDIQSEDRRQAMTCPLEAMEAMEATEEDETDFAEMVCMKSYHFASEEGILQEAIQRPDVFLQCCHSLFGEMLQAVDEMPCHPSARAMAEGLFVLFGELAFSGKRVKFQTILDAALAGAREAYDGVRKGTPPKD